MTVRGRILILYAVVSCIVLCLLDGFVNPSYPVKSAVKIIMFFVLPLFVSMIMKKREISRLLSFDKRGFPMSFFIGIIVYVMIILVFEIAKAVMQKKDGMDWNRGIIYENYSLYLVINMYIAFINSFIEEFFFRGLTFLTLEHETAREKAYFISSLMFSLYHFPMLFKKITALMLISALVILFFSGYLFNKCDEKYRNIYPSWVIHIFANLALNTLGIYVLCPC